MSKKRALLFVANQHSGNGQTAARVIRAAQRGLWGWEVITFFPDSAAEARRRIDVLENEAISAVFIVGGDGTLNQLLPSLVRKKIPVALFPAGTANDLARKLGLAKDWELYQSLLDHGAWEDIDVISVNGKKFATVGGIGVGSILTQEFNEHRARRWWFRAISRPLKAQVYTWLSAKTILTRNDYFHDLRIEADDYRERIVTPAVFICNQSTLAGDLLVESRALNSDGRFEVTVLQQSGKKDLIQALRDLKSGRVPKGAIRFSTKKMKIEEQDGRALSVFGDGEILEAGTELEFSVIPRALRVFRQEQLGSARKNLEAVIRS